MKKLAEINLIKTRAVTVKSDLRILGYIRLGYLLCAVCALGLLGHGLAIGMAVAHHHTKLEALQAKILNERNQLGIEAIEAEWKSYANRLATIEQVAANRTNANTMFLTLSQYLPHCAVLNGWSLNTTNGMTLTINVNVINKEVPKNTVPVNLIMDFMEQLKKNELFGENVKVDSQEKINGDGTTPAGESFTISVIHTPPVSDPNAPVPQ